MRQAPSSKGSKPRAARPASLLARQIFARTRAPGFQKYLRDLLVALCKVDTSPNPEIAKMRAAEDACFRLLERELGALPFPGARMERRPINPAIAGHSNYSLLHFTKTAARPEGLSPEAAYAGRSNLLCFLPGTNQGRDGQSLALNAHVDVVAPYFPPRVKGGAVFGRGACDDKGPVVSMIAALKVLSEILSGAGIKLNRNLVAMFVIEEETGGNGSLSLAMDRDLKRSYDSILVGECTGLTFHPANRGAVWFRVEINAPAGVSPFEMFAFVNEEMEREGAAIRAESRHDLFPQRPVQTCHGMIGPFGEHPSRICGEVTFTIEFAGHPAAAAENLVRDCLESGLAGYVGLYGDKTKVMDKGTGKPMVARHYDLRRLGRSFVIRVHGATGHMGAIRERDGAITKMAHLVRSLIFSREKLSAAGGEVRLRLGNETAKESVGALTLEGGQGFVPTHTLKEITDRMRDAASRGADFYLRRLGRDTSRASSIKVTYEKLHNVAFDGAPDSPTVGNAIKAAKECGLWKNEPVLGWTVSCDARLFATEYPGMPVLTFGPGLLAHAHSDREQVELEDIRAAAEFIALFVLQQTGTAPATAKARRPASLR